MMPHVTSGANNQSNSNTKLRLVLKASSSIAAVEFKLSQWMRNRQAQNQWKFSDDPDECLLTNKDGDTVNIDSKVGV